jgi:hypothetical protein
MIYVKPDWTWVALLTVMLAGCGSSETGTSVSDLSSGGAKYLLSSEPPGAQDVKDVLASAQDGDDVTVVGRIGGDANPWIDGLAAFNIADLSLKPCSEVEGDNCPKPWDYCCEPELAACRTLVKVVDEGGHVVSGGARELLQLEELQTVVVRGKASRDDAGNVSVLATGVFVRQQNHGQ